MVELRKRKAPPEAAAPAPPAKKTSKAKGVKSAEGAPAKKKAAAGGAKKLAVNDAPSEGDSGAVHAIDLSGFGGELEMNDGKKSTLKQLIDESKSGVIIFTYPKASTPGCTTQAWLFRDHYKFLTAGGFAIYGLSRDSPKSNTNFKTKHYLPFSLLCDPSASLIDAIGMKKGSGTTRGVFVIDKEANVLLSKAGGPEATVEAARQLITAYSANTESKDTASSTKDLHTEKTVEDGSIDEKVKVSGEANGIAEKAGSTAEDVAQAEVAADVADTAEKLDGENKA